MVNLTTKYLGLTLKNPIIIGSSGLTDNVEALKDLEEKGAGAVVLKSLFEEEINMEMTEAMHEMTSRFFIYPETYDYMDIDSEEDTIRKYLRLIKEAKAALSIPVIASINCVSAQKWTYFAKEIEKAGADALELNLFILPSDLNRTAKENEQIYFDVIEQVKSKISIPVAVKMSPYFSNLGTMIQQISESGVAGIVMFNRFFQPDIDIDNQTITSGNVLSSPDEITTSLRWIAIMSNRVKCHLAASTGIHDGKAVIKQLLAGADAVEIVSTVYKNGSKIIPQILHTLENWMNENDCRNLNDFRGKLSQSRSSDPASFERVQFMKHFRHYVVK
jgi:dihydroorotate dehydrogenase (fumarate)